MAALTPEERRIRRMIEDAVGPLNRRLDRVEKELRRVKSDNQNLKSQIAKKR